VNENGEPTQCDEHGGVGAHPPVTIPVDETSSEDLARRRTDGDDHSSD
jgi:hypothetical protein